MGARWAPLVDIRVKNPIALPLWCSKKRSTTVPAPRPIAADGPRPLIARATISVPNDLAEADPTAEAKPIRTDTRYADLRPYTFAKGVNTSGPRPLVPMAMVV